MGLNNLTPNERRNRRRRANNILNPEKARANWKKWNSNRSKPRARREVNEIVNLVKRGRGMTHDEETIKHHIQVLKEEIASIKNTL